LQVFMKKHTQARARAAPIRRQRWLRPH